MWLLPAGPADAAPPAPSASKTVAKTVSWEGFVADVERTHPLMRAARSGIGELEAQLSRAEWAYFPRFKLDAAATITPEITGDPLQSTTTWDRVGYYFDVELTMVQPIYTFGKIAALKRAAKAGVNVGRAQVAAARWELRIRSAQAYYGGVLAKELGAILSDGKRWIDKAETRMEKLRDDDSDDYDQLEHLRLKTRVAEFYELEAQNSLLLTQARTGMRLLLSKERGDEVTPAEDSLEPIAYEFLDVDAYLALAIEAEPGLLTARRRARAEEALADAREAELWPDLVLVGEAKLKTANRIEDQQSVFADDPFNVSAVGAALGLRWNLDVPDRLYKAEAARAKAQRFENMAEVQLDVIELKVNELHQKLVNSRELIKILKRSRRAAQGWLTATWDTYDAGFGSFRDVMDALVQFYGKRVGYLQAVFAHNITVWELSRAVGTDITTLVRPTNTEKPAQ